MLFAHAPAGFLVTYFSRKIWAKNLTQSQINLLYLLGAVFGIFPDIDVLYYYLFSAVLRHREFFTHTFIFYFLLWIILLFLGRVFKNTFLKAAGTVFIFAVLSHLLLDSLSHGMMWLYPASSLTFGLLMIDNFAPGFYGKNFLFINYFLETIIFLAALNLIFYKFIRKYFKIVSAISYLILLLAIFILYTSSPYLYQGRSDFYYKDKDKDKIINMRDQDLDGDGILNIRDIDADGDGKKNIEQILQEAKKLEGIWHDRTEGGFWEIPSRSGFLSKTDAVIKPYNAAGIFLKKEMEEDFKKNPRDYASQPKNSKFDQSPYNFFIFFKNCGMLQGGKYVKKGDIIFYGEKINNIALVLDGNEKKIVRVLLVKDGKISFASNQEAQEKYEKIIGVGRLKYK